MGGMPRDGSQVGFAVMVAAESVLEGEGPVCVLEAMSQRTKRAGRSSMAVEVAAASLAFEHGDYARAMLCEMTEEKFALRDWRRHVARWRQYNVLDAKCAFDSLAGEGTPEDRRTAIDVSALRESLNDGSGSMARWVPGPQQAADCLTKWLGNDVLRVALTLCRWSLKESPEVRAERERKREALKLSKASKKAEASA